MENIFPAPVTDLPEADIPLEGCTAYISQAETHQLLFMKFDKDANLPEHFHRAQWGVVLAGKIELTIDGMTKIYSKGDRYFIPAGVKHSGHIFAGYADITFFDEPGRYKAKQGE